MTEVRCVQIEPTVVFTAIPKKELGYRPRG